MKNKLFAVAGALALAAVLAKSYGPPLIAQVRAALVKNLDEPGRVPYQELQTSSSDFGVIQYAYFPPVPAGKRLVITFVSGRAGYPAPSESSAVVHAAAAVPLTCCALPPGPFADLPIYVRTPTAATFSGLIQFYIEEGLTPVIRTVAPTGCCAFPMSARFTITGYLIDKSL